MPMPRRVNKRVQRKVYIDEEVNQKLNELLKDPGRKRVIYGTLSDYIEMLITKDLQDRGYLEQPKSPESLFKEAGKND